MTLKPRHRNRPPLFAASMLLVGLMTAPPEVSGAADSPITRIQASDPSAATAPRSSQEGADSELAPPDEHGRIMHLVEFTEPGLIHRPELRQPGQRFDPHSRQAVNERRRLEARQEGHMRAIGRAIGREVEMAHQYLFLQSGVALRLTESEAEILGALPFVAKVERDRIYQLDTFRGPVFMGADSIWDGSAVPSGLPLQGEGMVIAILDGGINAGHPSFANVTSCGHGQGGVPNKLLSALDCNVGTTCGGPNPNDGDGHGTHVASTAGGNHLDQTASPPPSPPVGLEITGVAPCAHIRSYKVCSNGCSGAAVQAGMNRVLSHGDVHVMNFSISGGTNPWFDNDRRKLDLVDADILVAASAGNTRPEIPDPVGQVNHLGPWVLTVAASTHDENIVPLISASGPGTPPVATQDILATRGSDSPAGSPLVDFPIHHFSGQDPGAEGCSSEPPFPAGFFNGAAALIRRGTCQFTEKITNAFNAGAAFVVIRNNQPGDLLMGTDGQPPVPAYSIAQVPGIALQDFVSANPTTATIDFEPDGRKGDVLAGFSLRGPSPSPFQNLSKPDITAPGVEIYAASIASVGSYEFMSGTSMSGPHVAGAATLVRQARPAWSPPEVKSALMMTSKPDGFKDDGTAPWDADDVGSGRADLTEAALAGMVMHETHANFLAANPGAGGDPRVLNIPSVRDMDCVDSCSWTRTLRNTLSVPTSWSASGASITPGFTISVDPPVFGFTGGLGETQTVTITATPFTDLASAVAFGEVVFTEASSESPDLHITVAIMGSGTAPPCDTPDPPTGLSAVASAANQVTLDWAPLALEPDSYRILRSTESGGPYSEIAAGVPGPPYEDNTVSGSTTYYYVAQAHNAPSCNSANSNEASAEAFGDCIEPPGFAGAQSVTELGGGQGCGLRVEWDAATPVCGSQVVYNVYRSTSGGFTPGPGNLLASCVAGTGYDDTSVNLDTTYHYIVRAEDDLVGGSGACGAGNEDGNSTQRSSMVSSGGTLAIYDNDFDSASGFSDWNTVYFEAPPPDDWRGVQNCFAASEPNIFRFGGATCTGTYTDGTDFLGSGNWVGAGPLLTTGIEVPAGATSTTLEFNHRWQWECSGGQCPGTGQRQNWDGAYLTLSLGASYFFIPNTSFLAGGYNGSLSSSTCLYAFNRGRAAWVGLDNNTAYSAVEVNLGPTCDAVCNPASYTPPAQPPAACASHTSGCAGLPIRVAFVATTDQCEGIAYQGWFIDDVVISAEVEGSACTSAPAPVQHVTATSRDAEVVLEWLNPDSGTYASTLTRASTIGFPSDPGAGSQVADTDAGGPGGHGSAIHNGLTNDQEYFYSAFVGNAVPVYSGRRVTRGFPFDTSGPGKWSFTTGAAALAPPTRLAGGGVYAASNDRGFYAMSPGEAGGTWPAGWIPRSMNAPAQSQPLTLPAAWTGLGFDFAAVSSQDGHLYCFLAGSSEACPGWPVGGRSVDDFGMLQAPPMIMIFPGSPMVFVVGSRNAGGSNGLHAVRVADGGTEWSFTNSAAQNGDDSEMGILSGPVQRIGTRVFFGTRAREGGSPGTLWAVELGGGAPQLAWVRTDIGDIDGAPTRNRATGHIQVGTNAGEVYTVDPADGSTLWSRAFEDGPIKGFITFRNGRLYFATTGNAWSIPADGSTGDDWQAALTSPSRPTVPLAGALTDRVYLGACADAACETGRLVELTDGEGDWAAIKTHDLAGAGGLGQVTIDGGLAHAGSQDGRIHALAVPLPLP